MKVKIRMKYYNGEALVRFAKFRDDGSWALQLIHPTTGECIASPSVCMTDYPAQRPDKNQIWIKGYSENEGAREALVDAGVIHSNTIQTFVNLNDAQFYLCELTPEALKTAESPSN